MADQEDDRTDDQPMNREQRRAERFGHSKHEQDGNPAFGTGDDSAAYAGRPDQDVVRTTGAGTGGATETDQRVGGHEGAHLGNQPNS